LVLSSAGMSTSNVPPPRSVTVSRSAGRAAVDVYTRVAGLPGTGASPSCTYGIGVGLDSCGGMVNVTEPP
jgi:hypothetical protein